MVTEDVTINSTAEKRPQNAGNAGVTVAGVTVAGALAILPIPMAARMIGGKDAQLAVELVSMALARSALSRLRFTHFPSKG